MRPDLSSAVVAALLIFAPQLSNAQETEPNTNDQAPRTLFGGQGKMTHGGWAAPTASYTQMLKQDAMLVGLRGGWLVNHRLTPTSRRSISAFPSSLGQVVVPIPLSFLGMTSTMTAQMTTTTSTTAMMLRPFS